MSDENQSKPPAHIICHCGKCDVKCNKHGKEAECADCGEVKLLGTAVENGKMRHICDECCEIAAQKAEEENNRRLSEAIRKDMSCDGS